MSFDTNFDADFDSPAQRPVERLIMALRSPLPEGFEWDFRQVRTCALGLAGRIGISHHTLVLGVSSCMHGRGIFDPVFAARETDGVVPLYGVPARAVSPAMVADALERLILQETAR